MLTLNVPQQEVATFAILHWHNNAVSNTYPDSFQSYSLNQKLQKTYIHKPFFSLKHNLGSTENCLDLKAFFSWTWIKLETFWSNSNETLKHISANKTKRLFTKEEGENSHGQETNISPSKSYFTPMLSNQLQEGESCDPSLKSSANQAANHSQHVPVVQPILARGLSGLQKVKVFSPEAQALGAACKAWCLYVDNTTLSPWEHLTNFFQFWKVNCFVNCYCSQSTTTLQTPY